MEGEIDLCRIFEAEDFRPELTRNSENWKNASAPKQRNLTNPDPREVLVLVQAAVQPPEASYSIQVRFGF
ncbi:MAG TPA: hypothetical protein VN844_12150 [Pyrinomonadaceae bacterium]|nr:hypothetical protein [Pyrinomonadaceae bacterium]